MNTPPASDLDASYAPFAQRMRAEQLPEIVIETFEYYFKQLQSGNRGLIAENQIRPVDSLPDLDRIPSQLSKRGKAANVAGFSLHAGVATNANERAKLERLCRYNTRPAVSTKRLSMTRNGQVRYELKTPWHNGTR